jgi:hypothetical protein
MTDDTKISRRYRSLAREEPPRHVDETILAAARRAADARPAPLVVPTGRRRWYFPLAAAAIIVLAVAVTMHVERQEPDLEMAEAPVPPPAPASEEPAARAQAPAEPPRAFTPDPKPAPPRAAAPAPAAVPEVSGRQDAVGAIREAPGKRAALQSRAEATAGAVSGLGKASPEQWLQGIADLRRQGRHEEADKALAEFRRAYPDYRISEAMLEKVEKK